MISENTARSLVTFMVAIGALIFGLLPQMLVFVSLKHITHLFVLLFAAYASLFASLSFLPPSAAWVARMGGVKPPLPGLRMALLLEAGALSGMWYTMINPFPAGPFMEAGQYLPVILVALVLLMAWFFFLFLMKKLL